MGRGSPSRRKKELQNRPSSNQLRRGHRVGMGSQWRNEYNIKIESYNLEDVV
jgi:hypothetical protein